MAHFQCGLSPWALCRAASLPCGSVSTPVCARRESISLVSVLVRRQFQQRRSWLSSGKFKGKRFSRRASMPALAKTCWRRNSFPQRPRIVRQAMLPALPLSLNWAIFLKIKVRLENQPKKVRKIWCRPGLNLKENRKAASNIRLLFFFFFSKCLLSWCRKTVNILFEVRNGHNFPYYPL